MKKVLFATTALVGLAGAAAAEVSISGYAEMGIIGGGANATNGSAGETQFHQDIDVTFTMTGESDSGLSFGASVDLDEADFRSTDTDGDGTFEPGEGINALDDSTDDNGYSVFVSGSFGRVTMGDTDGALDWAITDAGNVGNPGSIADEETSHAGYFGAFHDGVYDGQILRYDYSFGAFGVAVSVEQDDAGVRDMGYALGLKYALDLGGTTVNLGAGVQSVELTTGDADIWAVSAQAAFAGGFQAGIQYTDGDILGNPDSTHVGIGLGYESGPIAIHANWGEFDFGGAVADADGFGISAAYDLGGGLSAHLGYGDGNGADDDSWSLGMAMSF